ncbi:hypothetical protein CONLIGDRAFT_686824 [Coniochaeta ligniaria NRRL 30616]|uniref:Uncharacterized protein n=1 Tax=Coniochaeta ligniaria NRRL 30616 TaxID=1408157 RepID=A0A1J7I7P3_9PEZI|nr:hypothetical protein CONLIGDRAFT_686824 [Coniochaeta ligniaria NRRL 30616]
MSFETLFVPGGHFTETGPRPKQGSKSSMSPFSLPEESRHLRDVDRQQIASDEIKTQGWRTWIHASSGRAPSVQMKRRLKLESIWDAEGKHKKQSEEMFVQFSSTIAHSTAKELFPLAAKLLLTCFRFLSLHQHPESQPHIGAGRRLRSMSHTSRPIWHRGLKPQAFGCAPHDGSDLVPPSNNVNGWQITSLKLAISHIHSTTAPPLTQTSDPVRMSAARICIGVLGPFKQTSTLTASRITSGIYDTTIKTLQDDPTRDFCLDATISTTQSHPEQGPLPTQHILAAFKCRFLAGLSHRCPNLSAYGSSSSTAASEPACTNTLNVSTFASSFPPP